MQLTLQLHNSPCYFQCSFLEYLCLASFSSTCNSVNVIYCSLHAVNLFSEYEIVSSVFIPLAFTVLLNFYVKIDY